ncbi:Glutamate 5-kinase [Dimargaris xerosporica]|nr:Glutamate 5-kinase [Dimargaris xerosporica]
MVPNAASTNSSSSSVTSEHHSGSSPPPTFIAGEGALQEGLGSVEMPRHHQHPLNKAAKTGLTIVLKLGTSSICDPVTHMPQLSNLSTMVELVSKLRSLGHRVILVSSGAVGVGLLRLNLPAKPSTLDKIQAVAAVGQGRLMALWDDLFGQLQQPIAQMLLTRNDLANRNQYLNACNCFEALLDMGVIPIVNENDTISVGEIRFGDNDTLSAIAAGMVHADFLFLLTDVDCLYTDNPRTNPGAQPIITVHDIQNLKEQITVTSAGSSVGTGGMVTKLIAAELAAAKGVDTVIARGSTCLRVLDIIQELAPELCNLPATDQAGKPHAPYYTRFVAKPNPMVDRKWWILHGLHPAGTVVIDAGALVAVAKFKKSLFAAGIIRVEGSFAANQGVRIVYETRKLDSATLSRVSSIGSDNSQHGDLSGLAFRNTIRAKSKPTSPKLQGESESDDGSSSPNSIKPHEIVERIEIGHGLVNYASSEIKRIRGKHSSEFIKLLGYADSDCVINRTNMAITVEPHVIENFFSTNVRKNKIRAEQTLPILQTSLHSPSSAANSPRITPLNGPMLASPLPDTHPSLPT